MVEGPTLITLKKDGSRTNHRVDREDAQAIHQIISETCEDRGVVIMVGESPSSLALLQALNELDRILNRR